MKHTLGALGLAFGLGLAPAGAATIYSNDFEGGSTANLTGAAIQTAPNGQKFYGVMSVGSSAVLTLTGLSGYSSFDLAFDLYALNSLDGDGTSFCCGPDSFKLVANGTTLLDETFSVVTSWVQSYGGAGSPGGTGADPLLTGTLGYYYWGPDHTYHLNFGNIAGNVSSLVIEFFGNSDQEWGDEGFGIDNIEVTGTPVNVGAVPLPAGLPLMLAGLGALGLLARRRKAA